MAAEPPKDEAVSQFFAKKRQKKKRFKAVTLSTGPTEEAAAPPAEKPASTAPQPIAKSAAGPVLVNYNEEAEAEVAADGGDGGGGGGGGFKWGDQPAPEPSTNSANRRDGPVARGYFPELGKEGIHEPEKQSAVTTSNAFDLLGDAEA